MDSFPLELKEIRGCQCEMGCGVLESRKIRIDAAQIRLGECVVMSEFVYKNHTEHIKSVYVSTWREAHNVYLEMIKECAELITEWDPLKVMAY